MKKHTLIAMVQDRPGVLNRAVSLFRRRNLNIESLAVGRTDKPGISKMTWVVEAENVTPVIAQLKKLIEVLDVYENTENPSSDTSKHETTSDARANTSQFNALTKPFLFSGLSQADGIA